MPNETNDLPPPVNHVFVDFENVHEIDHAIIGNKTVHFTLLLGSRQTKLDVALVEKLLRHAAAVELVRLTSAGKNALDFTLSYYVGRAVVADPTGYFHIISKDAGFDPLIEHLRSRHIKARRHDGFSTLTFAAATKPAAAPPTAVVSAGKPPAKPVVSKPSPPVPGVKPPPKPKVQSSHWGELEARVLKHLRQPATNRPGSKKRLVSFLIAYLGNKITSEEALQIIELLEQAGHLVIDDKGKVTYHLEHQ